MSIVERPQQRSEAAVNPPQESKSWIDRRLIGWPAIVCTLETLLLVGMVLLILHNRFLLGQQFLFAYSDEDQTLLWHAANDLLHGQIPEPCFYGQSFNSCLEGYMAAPLILLHIVPYWVAVPSVAIVLGLFPFLAMAWVAWRRGRCGLAALSLAVPLVLPVRYAMLTGMPRGFVTGIALAIIPCLLLLKSDAPSIVACGKDRAKWRSPARYLLIGLLSVVALTLNPNCSLMLPGALVYAIATRWRNATFWLFSSMGAFLGALYPLGIFVFYFNLHDDYRLYHREEQYNWSVYNFQQYLHHLNIPLGDFLPVDLSGYSPVWVLGTCFAAVLIYLLVTRRWVAALATVGTVAFAIYTLGYKRVHEGSESVFFAYSRMYLAVPVLPILLLVWADARKAAAHAMGYWAWIGRGSLAALVGLALFTSHRNAQASPHTVAMELDNVEVLQVIDVGEARNIARAVQSAADSQSAHFVLLVGNQKRWTYLLPTLTDCQTLYPDYERRTWRLNEESFPRYKRILVMDRALFDRASRAGFSHPVAVSEVPFIGAFGTGGESVIRICQDLGTDVRAFKIPSGSDIHR
ncbi:MAG TPA: hypothetical protein VM008_22170 [Phycisphaerae bacterium]|nr:hypothetical protein [Phycisphaerae bacterium]